MAKTYVYKLWSADKVLLYVGISKSLMTRIDQHAKGKEWAEEIETVTAKAYPSRDSARAAEIQAIKAENPQYNILDRAPLNFLELSREQWDAMNEQERIETARGVKNLAGAIMAATQNVDKNERWPVGDAVMARGLAAVARELERGTPPDVAMQEYFSAGLEVNA
jgi:predicted GIY-YIG superfamily endonuclease